MNFATNSLVIVIIVASVSLAAGAEPPAQSRPQVNLDGVWNFATDPDNRGEAEKWYLPSTKLPAMPLPGYARGANGKIRVPGIWDNQGYGTETDRFHHHFEGKGWYQREIAIPREWKGQRVFLVITGVCRYSKTWINGQFLGEHVGYVSAQEHDITAYVTPGQIATLTIQVDSKQRWAIDSLAGASSLIDFVDTPWGGIWGHVFLEARADCWLSDLFVRSDVSDSSCSASAVLRGDAVRPDRIRLEVFDAAGRRVAETTNKLATKPAAGEELTVKAAWPDPALWTLESPNLYRARLSLLSGDKVLDAVDSRFGMRQFAIDGHHLLLNGKRIMLCGYGDDHIYPAQMAMPCDKEMHLTRLRKIKSYGFNHVRHHSTIMPPEYYDACDEVGMICTAEFPIAYRHFLPGTGTAWKAHVPPGTDPGPAIETYKQQWAAAIKRFRNHPSIFCWVMGNEIYDGIPLRVDFHRLVHELDPSRFFADSDGVWGAAICAAYYNERTIFDAENDRDTLDLFFTQFDEVGGDPIQSPGKYASPRPTKPMILHEAGNYVTFSRPDLADQFQHNMKPFWLTTGRAKLEKLGLLQEANAWAEKSERLYALCHKFNIEFARKSPYISGYHWWLFQDYWTSSNGIVDHYFRPKSVTPEEVLQYNGDVVLLQDGLARTYRGGDRLQLKLFVSNYSPKNLQGNLNYEVQADGRTVVQERLTLQSAPQGELSAMTTIDLELPDVEAPVSLKIAAALVSGNKKFTNQWATRLYPAVIRPAALPLPVFADQAQIEQCKAWGAQPIPEEGELVSRAVYVVGWPCDPRVIAALKKGASVVMLEGAELLLKSHTIRFRTSWWKAGDSPRSNHTGTLVYDHPVTRAMAPDGWCDDGWFHLIEGANKFVWEGVPKRPDVMIRALPGIVLIQDAALLFEVGVEKGTLLVSGLNHHQAQERPENQWLVARLLERAAKGPQPKAKWPASFLAIISVAPDGCLSGFRRLVANEGEEGTWHSYREDKARMIFCRQTKPGNTITWQTAPVPRKVTGDSVTFVFAGGTGYGSEPKTKGFALDINGREALRFDLPKPAIWQSRDKRVELRFEVRRTMSADQFGLFHLTAPRHMLEPGEPCVLRVRSIGTGSRRWFGLNPYF